METALNEKTATLHQKRGPTRSTPTKKSSNPLVSWVWRSYIWVAGTFSLGMLEVWEQLLVFFVVLSLSSLIWWSVYFHFPNHIRSVVERGTYYIFGTSNSSHAAVQYTKSVHVDL